MTPTTIGRRLLLLVAICIALVVAGTGTVVACETCADPDHEEEDHEPYWSNEEFPYNTSENRSFVEIVVDETEEEMEEDFGGENGSTSAAASTSVGDRSVAAAANADVDPVGEDASTADGAVTVALGASIGG